MDPILLLLPVLLPPVCGLGLLLSSAEDAKRNRLVMAFTVLNSLLTAGLLLSVREGSTVVYSFTGAFSIALGADGLSRLFAGMLAVMWPLVTLYAFSYMEQEKRRKQFFAFFLMTYGVTLGAAFSANLTTLYVFFEMLTLVTLPLVTHKEDSDSLFAGRRYLNYCLTGAAMGLAATVAATLAGAGDFRYGGSITGADASELMRVFFLLGFFGFGVKTAIFPFFLWLPTASVAPTPVTALLHAVAVVNTGIFSVARLTWYAFGPTSLSGTWVQTVCLTASAFSLLFGAVMALRQRHLKRRLAYSTMSNLSYMLFGISLMTTAGFEGALAHMLFHSVMKMTLFLCAGAWIHRTGNEYIYEAEGIGRKMPVTFGCFTLCALSLSGIPPLCGFVSKWQLLQAGMETGTTAAWIGVGCLLTAAFLCAIYSLSICIRAFFPGNGRIPAGAEIREADGRMLAPIIFFSLLSLLFGVFQTPVMQAISAVAAGM